MKDIKVGLPVSVRRDNLFVTQGEIIAITNTEVVIQEHYGEGRFVVVKRVDHTFKTFPMDIKMDIKMEMSDRDGRCTMVIPTSSFDQHDITVGFQHDGGRVDGKDTESFCIVGYDGDDIDCCAATASNLMRMLAEHFGYSLIAKPASQSRHRKAALLNRGDE